MGGFFKGFLNKLKSKLFSKKKPTEQTSRKKPKYFRSKKLDASLSKLLNKEIHKSYRGKGGSVSFTYHKPDGTKGSRSIIPYTAKKTKKGYLLVGFDKNKGELRSFSLDRMKQTKTAFWKGFINESEKSY
jgi:predicted DNA-binding transcriptional regulator YafY